MNDFFKKRPNYLPVKKSVKSFILINCLLAMNYFETTFEIGLKYKSMFFRFQDSSHDS